MVRHLLLIAFYVFPFQLWSQTGIGTTMPHASAKLEVASDKQGFLPPRVILTSATDNTTISTPAEGLLVYNKGSAGLQAGYYYWNGANWATIATASSAGNGVTAMDMVKLYSKAYSAASGDIAHSGGYIFTVPVSGRYIFDFSSTGFASSTNATMTFKIRQGSNEIGTDVQTSYNNVVHVEYNGKIEVNLQAGTTYNVTVSTTGLRDAGDYDRVYYKMIAGNLPVTGQSVDYVSVQSSGQTVVTGNTIKFQNTLAGNIPYNSTTGNFTLTAGKTYRLTAYATLDVSSSAGAEIDFVWKNAAGDKIGNYAILFSENANLNASGQGVADIIYTPSTNTTVSVYVEYVAGTIALRGGYTNAIITQIGSSAIVNPWVLSGNDVYNTTGKVGIGTNAPAYTLDVSGTAKITTTPSTTLASNVLVKDPTTSQISEQPISYITGVAKFINNTSQTTIAANTIVKLNTTTLNTISSYASLNTTSGVITLQPGTYELNGTPGAGWAANGGGDSRCYPLFHNGTNYIGTGGVVESGPAGNYNTMPQNNANCVITVPVGQTATISLRLVVSTNMGGISSTGDYGDVADAGRAWVVVRKYN